MGLLHNDYFVPKFKKDYYNNANNNFRNNDNIEVIEEFDNDILDNMIKNNSLDQRFKTKSLPSLDMKKIFIVLLSCHLMFLLKLMLKEL